MTPAKAAMARLVKVMEVPPTVKVRPLEKPRPHTKMTACNDQVSGFCQIHMVFYDITNTDCGDHTVKHEADTTDNGSRHGTDDSRKPFGIKLKTTA